MNDFRTLTDAFDELERRADAHGEHPTPAPGPQHRRALLVAATVVAVAALATGTAVLADDHDPHSAAGGGAGPTSQPSPDAPVARQRQTPTPTPVAQHHRPKPNSAIAGVQVPQDPDQLISEFQAVLSSSATFTVTDKEGGSSASARVPAVPSSTRSTSGGHLHRIRHASDNTSQDRDIFITGVLTSADHVSGGYDLQILNTGAGATAMCDDPDRALCDTSTLPDGSTLALGREPLQEGPAGGVTYQADLVTPDGVEVLMHVSNERDPKGASTLLAPNPPLTRDQLKAIVTSDQW